MAHTGPIVGLPTGHMLQALVNHQKLVSTIFPRSRREEMADAPGVSSDDREEMFHSAASQGMLCSVAALLADGRLSCDLPDRFGRTPLHWAAEQGHLDVVLALLRAGACVDPRSQCKATPIMLAASGGHVGIVGVLVHYRAGESDCWPFSRHRRGIDHWRSTALHYAAAGGHVAVVRHLLDAGFDRGQHDGAGLTPAEVSARESHPSSPTITHLLLPSDGGGKLVYSYVSMMVEDVAIVSGLAKGGAFLDWQNGNGETPLHRAVHHNHVAILRVLLQAGADPNIRDRRGTSPLHIAACTGCGEIVAELLRAGADMEPQRVGGQTPLHMAVVNNKENVVGLLLKAGASTEHRDTIHGQTPLSWACERCLAPIVRLLVEAEADVESRCFAGLTPLHWACRFNDAESVEVLLNAGADPGAVDQAAADDGMETVSCRNGTFVSAPVAVDVVGLGYPRDCKEDSRSPSVTSAARWFDLDSVQRIQSALQDAKQERSWRRRGWLVILANRCDAMRYSRVRDRRCTGCPGGSGLLLDNVKTSMKTNTNSISTDYSHDVQQERTDEQNHLSKMLRSGDNTIGIARPASPQRAHTRGEMGLQEENVEVVLFLQLVGALFEVAGVEAGVFRRVVLFI